MKSKLTVKENMPEKIKGYKTLRLEDGREFEIPVVKTEEELYGPAYPSGIDVTDEEAQIARLISKNCDINNKNVKDRTEILISYIRDTPVVIKHKLENGKVEYQLGTGAPLACLVAFKYGNKVRLGWSQTNKAGEPSIYSKEKARVCAVLRGMKDSINMKSKTFAVNKDNRIIPTAVSKNIRRFADRTKRYFKQDFSNFTK